MKKMMACLLATGALSILVSGCTCTGKASAPKEECKVEAPKDKPAAAVPMDHPAH